MTYAPRLLTLTFASVAALTLATGCAVKKNQAGHIEFRLDDAELLGKVVQTFRMPDGSEARLRVLNGRYSIKLQKQLTVIPIDNAAQAEVKSVHQVGNRALVLVAKSTAQCGYQSQLVAIQDLEALSWDFGDCFHAPEARTYPDSATFDIRQDNGSTTRFTYQDGKLMRGAFQGTPPGAPPAGAAPVPAGAPRYVPGLPSGAVAGDKPAANKVAPATPVKAAPVAESKPAATPAKTTSAPRSAPAPAKALDFPTQEQKPVRIILDK